jgi:carbon-monoxide dehydrogenase large subunit
VLTGRDYAADGWGHPTSRHNDVLGPRRNVDGSEFFAPPNVVLPADRVRHVGDAVAIVIATSLGAATAAADRVYVDYDPLPHVTSAVDALSAGAPVVWDERPDNLCANFTTGDEEAVTAALARAVHVVDIEVESRRVTAAPIEPRAAIGQCEPDGRLTLYATSQGADRLRRVLVEDVLRVPAEQLRVVTRDVGGSFGMKAGVYTEYVLVLWAAKRLGRPVKWVSGRSEAFVSDTHGRDIRSRAELGLDAQGRMLALRVESIASLGAYPGPRGPMIGVFAHPLCLTGQYDIGAASYRGKVVYTNTNSVSPYRGSGQPEAAFVLERLVDKAVRLAEFATFAARRREAQSRGRLRGIGLAAFVEVSGGVPVEWGALRITPDGRVEVTTGIQNIGTGHETTFPQIVAERLGVPESSVTLRYGDTQFVKKGAGTHASRSTLMAGTVLSRNMDAAIERGTRIAAHLFNSRNVAQIHFVAPHFVSTEDGQSIGLFEIAQRAEAGDGLPDELRGPLQFENEYLRDPTIQTASNGCQVCEVEIDPDTGSVAVVRFSAVDAVGRVINHDIVHGQVRGGIAQGIGQALLEQIVYEPESGQLLTGSFLDYPLPRAADLPPIAIEDYEDAPSATNPLGVKGAGEGGAIGAPAAVANAVMDALSARGIEHIDPPYTPERIWQALQTGR